MSYVLFRLHQPQEQEDDRKQEVDLIKVLRESLPELGGRIYEAEDLGNDGQSGVILQVSTDERFRAARQVRTILREKGLAFKEGVLTEQVAVQSLRGRREDAERCFEAGKAFSHLGMLDEAIVEFEQALTHDPMFTEAYHYLTAIYRQQGANDEALCLLEDEARFQGHEASFQYLYGKLLSDLGQREPALERLKAAVRLNPRAAEPYLLMGKMFLEDGDLEGSELSFLQALTHGPRTPEASLGLGSISLSRGEFDAAEDHLLDALDMNQELDEARLMLGWTYFRDGRMEQAEVEFLQVAYGRHSEFHVSAKFSLAQLYLERGNPEMVLEVLSRADGSLFEVPEANRVKGDALYLVGRNHEALASWDQASRMGLLESPELSLRRAVALSRVGQLAAAEALLEELELRNGADTALLELKASLRMANDDWEGAHKILQRAQDNDPNSAMIAFQLGWAAENLGLIELSEANYNKAVRLDPSLHEAYSGLGWLYYQREQYSEALVLFEEALALQPRNPEMLEQVAWVQLLLHEDLSALANLDLAVRLEPYAPLLRAYRACALIRLGEHDEARREVEAALANPDDEMVEALGHYLNGLLFLEEGDDVQASVELERSLDSQELPPEVVQ
ncbi:MAG: tetratricopeptide repeat protein, partial [Candidatus Eremiobacteraeota bacterium]|nr:tetratricopeptide repeat protein [Candidatus Eremiobacteraeota bacterium]